MGHIDPLPEERAELERRVRSRSLRAYDSRRAGLILMLADGESYLRIRTVLKCNANYASRSKARFEEDRLAGLFSRHGGGAHLVLTPGLEARILEKTRQPPGMAGTGRV